MVNHRADLSHGESPSRIARSEELSRSRLETKATGEEKATAACMGPANTASPGTIQYDPKTTTVRARMGGPQDPRSRLRALHFHEQVLVRQAVWVLNRHKQNNGSYT